MEQVEKDISVTRAKELIQLHTKPLGSVLLELNESLGMVLAEDVIATIDFPRFLQSGMDGFALTYEPKRLQYQVVGEVKAGEVYSGVINTGEAVRIFTGAPLPVGADTVIMQERVERVGQTIRLLEEPMNRGLNTRAKGSEIQAGQLVLKSGTVMSPGAIGLLASLGIGLVKLISKPRIGLLLTGNEIAVLGSELKEGAVFDSNSHSINAWLNSYRFGLHCIEYAMDDPIELQARIEKQLEEVDVLFVTGGVSVGDYDFTVAASEKAGVKSVFHRIKQKPGKPLYFGTKGSKLVFGLPGNPGSVLTCLWQYVLPALGKIMSKDLSLKVAELPLVEGFEKKAGLSFFLKAFVENGKVYVTKGQESFRLTSFAHANALVELAESTTTVSPNEPVKVYYL